MDLRREALALALLFAAAPVRSASAQARASETVRHDAGRSRGALAPNAPNPFADETIIPFVVGDDSCTAGTGHHVVTLRVYNILSQLVATPTLADTAIASDSTAAAAAPVSALGLACGAYRARWDGRHHKTHRPAPAGVYVYQLLVDGQPAGTRKMMIARDR